MAQLPHVVNSSGRYIDGIDYWPVDIREDVKLVNSKLVLAKQNWNFGEGKNVEGSQHDAVGKELFRMACDRTIKENARLIKESNLKFKYLGDYQFSATVEVKREVTKVVKEAVEIKKF